jgi:hypothetical protein
MNENRSITSYCFFAVTKESDFSEEKTDPMNVHKPAFQYAQYHLKPYVQHIFKRKPYTTYNSLSHSR